MLQRLALFLCLLAAAPASAELRAVLIGVSDYRALDVDLKGPAHDVRLMAEVLVGRGVPPSRMVVLTTDPSGLPKGVETADPTRAGILAAMAAAAEASVSGDTVVFYFSGHGAEAPDRSGDEGGGYDEILLPADAAGWKGAVGAVENAILDDELQIWAQGMLSRGVALVGLVDACHSATGFRAVGGPGVARGVAPEDLGIPAEAALSTDGTGASLTGDFVFLYSSQADQRSFEYPLGESDVWHGEFTLRLAEVLRTAPDASWAQVLTATTDAMVQGAARQVPEGEGPLLAAQVFGEGMAEARLRVEGAVLHGGFLQGLRESSEVTLFAEAAGGEPLGLAEVSSVGAREARLNGALPQEARWAEVTALAAPAPLRLAAPVRHDPGDGLDYSEWIAALPPGEAEADLVPILTGGRVALAGADGVLDPEGQGSSPRIVPLVGESEAEAVERMLAQAAHGLNLRAILTGASGRSLTGKAAISLQIERRKGQPGAAGCGAPGEGDRYDPALGVSGCDQLWLTVENSSGKTQDISVLYFAADFEVVPIWPVENLVNRLAPGEIARVGLQIEQGEGAGLEEIWVLAVPADPDAPRVDLTRLVTPGTTRAIPGAADEMTGWLASRLAAANGENTRGYTMKPAPLAMIRQFVRLAPVAAAPQ
jgi:metacaspase-1